MTHGSWLVTLWFQGKATPRFLVELRGDDWTVGRVQDNAVVIPRGNLAKRHQRLTARDGQVVLADMKSTNGTYVNGRRISGPVVLTESCKVYIGDFVYGVASGPSPIEPEDVAPPRWLSGTPWEWERSSSGS